MQYPQRKTAYKVQIGDLIRSRYIQEDNALCYVVINDKEVAKVNIIANVISKYGNDQKDFSSISLDDGSGVIRAKLWKEDLILLKDVNIGDLVLVIGRLKEYNQEIYIVPEVVRILKDRRWAKIRKIELERLSNVKQKVEEEVIEESNVTARQKILNIIEKSEGVNFEEVLKKSKFDEKEVREIIESLLEEGEIYKPREGILMVI